MLIMLGMLALLAAALAALFTVGTIVAVAVVVVIAAATVYGVRVGGGIARGVLAGQGVVLVASLAFMGITAFQIVQALGDTSGEVDPPNAAALASANAKLDGVEGFGGFSVTLTQDELVAVLQDTLREADSNPIRSVELTIVDPTPDAPGVVDFTINFKGGGLSGNGSVAASLDAGRIELEVRDVTLGNLALPGIARGAVNDLVDTVLDLNERLADVGADVQLLEIGQGRVLIVGAQAGGDLLTASSLLTAIADNASSLAGAVSPPAEQIGAGDVNAREAEGPSFVVALGDSLAANVGVAQAREGYVSRFHGAVAQRDGVAYGLRNYGVSGATSGTLISRGQLESARTFILDRDVSYITIDIGANDLLGHLGSSDCADDVQAPACQARLDAVLVSYRQNLDRILSTLRSAAGKDTPILMLLTYNPFSLGFGGAVGLEAGSDAATTALNGVAREIAGAHGAIVADGQAALHRSTAATTHMLDAPPDVHPRAIGYDPLASALVKALP